MYRAAGLNARLGVERANLADEAQRVDRLAIAPQLDRDFGTRLAGDASVAGGALSVDAGLGVRNFGAADFYGAYPSYEDTRTATVAAQYERALASGWHRWPSRRPSPVFSGRSWAPRASGAPATS